MLPNGIPRRLRLNRFAAAGAAAMLTFVLLSLFVVRGPLAIDIVLGSSQSERLELFLRIMPVTDLIRIFVANWSATELLTFVCCLTAIRRRSWRVPAVVCVALSIAMLGAMKCAPVIFHRPGPDTSLDTYPNLYVSNSIAFYGYLIYCAFSRSAGWVAKVITCAALFLSATESVIVPVYFGFSWFTDVAGGFVLGIALLSGAVLLDCELRSRSWDGSKGSIGPAQP